MTRNNIPMVAWILYGLMWVLLLANVINDWMTQGWISPFTFLMVALLVGGTLLERFGVLSPAKGLRDPRVGLTYGLIALLLVALVIYLGVSGG